jgi:hypothetical protein
MVETALPLGGQFFTCRRQFGTYWLGRGLTVQKHGPRSFRCLNSQACAEFCGQRQKAHGLRPGAAAELGLSGSPRISGALDPLTPCGATASPFDAQDSGASRGLSGRARCARRADL